MKTERELKYIRAKNRVDREKGFFTHLAIYLLVNIGITFFKVWGDFGSWDEFYRELTSINVWSTWAVWGMLLVFHFIMFKYGGKWEDKKINELMNNELSNK